MHELDAETYPQADSWSNANAGRTDVTPGKLAKRADELMKRRRPGHTLMVVVDEVGQFVARDVQKMLDLQAIVQNFGTVSRGRHWLVVTSQERLGELVSGLDDKRVEHARLMDRFPSRLQVHLESTDIAEVTSRRVLAKNAAAQATLGALFDENRARLTDHTQVAADIKLPDLTRDKFIDLYPLLPYQVDLIIGDRVRPALPGRHQPARRRRQPHDHQARPAAADPPGHGHSRICPSARSPRWTASTTSSRATSPSEVRGKIAEIPQRLPNAHPLAQPVAKAICMLQYVKTFKRTPENIAATLHAGVAADSAARIRARGAQPAGGRPLRAQRRGRLPDPEPSRGRLGAHPQRREPQARRRAPDLPGGRSSPSGSRSRRTCSRAPSPSRPASRSVAKVVTEGDITFQVQLAEDDAAFAAEATELRARSRTEQSRRLLGRRR